MQSGVVELDVLGGQLSLFWMKNPKKAPKAMIDTLLANYCTLTATLFEEEQDCKEEHYKHTFGTDLLLLIARNDEMTSSYGELPYYVAASSYSVINNEILYINAALVHPSLQGKGVFNALLKYVVQNHVSLFSLNKPLSWVCGRSQNISFAKALKRVFARVYPLSLSEETPESKEEILCKGAQIAEYKGAGGIIMEKIAREHVPAGCYCYHTMLCKEIYGGHKLMKNVPIISESHFNTIVDVEKGDAVLLLCRMRI